MSASAGEPPVQRGAEAFAERARRELQATGATTRRRTVTAQTAPQKAQIARLAGDGPLVSFLFRLMSREQRPSGLIRWTCCGAVRETEECRMTGTDDAVPIAELLDERRHLL
ncbi:hypothetical protein [Streptomyces bicolor]|uniref:hypothetical protein n=1 Tax=Streptomyces bicolor TaxID=66874 RepID=UPI000D13EC30|nr:hypothetical protein [Streptomyces bicolor]